MLIVRNFYCVFVLTMCLVMGGCFSGCATMRKLDNAVGTITRTEAPAGGDADDKVARYFVRYLLVGIGLWFVYMATHDNDGKRPAPADPSTAPPPRDDCTLDRWGYIVCGG